MANENVLRQADNKVTLEGVLTEKRIELKTINGKEAITGEIDIRTDEDSVHTVRLFSYKLKNDGTENGIFKGLETVMNEYQSVAQAGEEAADKVRITAGQIGLNEYYGQDGQLKSFTQISSSFVNRVKATEEYSPRAEVELEVFVKSVLDETDKEGEATGRAKMVAIVPVYGGKVVPMEFIIADEGAIDYVTNNYEPGCTTKIYGALINSVKTEKTQVAVAFGKPKEHIKTTTVREIIITGGTEAYEEENPRVYKVEDIQKAMAERKIFLDQLKEKKSTDNGGAKQGFNVGSKSAANTNKKPATDLPF